MRSSSTPKPEFESVTEDKAIGIGKKGMLVELTQGEYEMWETSEEKKRQDALICPFVLKLLAQIMHYEDMCFKFIREI